MEFDDDFDFKPMTAGLGFDKKAEEVKHSLIQTAIASKPLGMKSIKAVDLLEDVEETETTAPVSRSLQKMLDSLPPSMDFINDVDRTQGLRAPEPPKVAMPPARMPEPEKRYPATRHPETRYPENSRRPVEPHRPAAPVQRSTPEPTEPMIAPRVPQNFDVTLNNSIANAFPRVEFQKSFFHKTVTPQKQFREVPASFASALIDGIVTLGITALFVVGIILLTDINLVKLLRTDAIMLRTGLEILGLYFGVTAVYYMISRSLCGSSLGDWAFDIQLGSEDQRMHMMYPLQVFFRVVVVLLSGIILVPLISIGFGKDIAEKFSGLKLYARQY